MLLSHNFQDLRFLHLIKVKSGVIVAIHHLTLLLLVSPSHYHLQLLKDLFLLQYLENILP